MKDGKKRLTLAEVDQIGFGLLTIVNTTDKFH